MAVVSALIIAGCCACTLVFERMYQRTKAKRKFRDDMAALGRINREPEWEKNLSPIDLGLEPFDGAR